MLSEILNTKNKKFIKGFQNKFEKKSKFVDSVY